MARAAVWVVGDMFIHLKRNMESELEKEQLHKKSNDNKTLQTSKYDFSNKPSLVDVINWILFLMPFSPKF